MSQTRIEDDIQDPNAPVEGARRVYWQQEWDMGIRVWVASGWLMPRASPEVLAASPGIQSWSIPE